MLIIVVVTNIIITQVKTRSPIHHTYFLQRITVTGQAEKTRILKLVNNEQMHNDTTM